MLKKEIVKVAIQNEGLVVRMLVRRLASHQIYLASALHLRPTRISNLLFLVRQLSLCKTHSRASIQIGPLHEYKGAGGACPVLYACTVR